jgi:hypothetical protein
MTDGLIIAGDNPERNAPLLIPADTPVGNYKAATPAKRMPDFNPGKQYHRTGLQSYAYQNSLTGGVRYATAHGYKSMDLDQRLSLDGIPLNCHDDLPCKDYGRGSHRGGFIGPADYRISKHNHDESLKLVHRDGYHIVTIQHRLLELTQANLIGQVEPKAFDKRYTPDYWGEFYRWCVDHNVRAMIKMLDNIPGHNTVLDNARKVGFKTRVIVSANL